MCETSIHSSRTSETGSAREAVELLQLIRAVKHMSAPRRHPCAKHAAVERRKKPHICKWLKRICLAFQTRIILAQQCSVVRTLSKKKIDFSQTPKGFVFSTVVKKLPSFLQSFKRLLLLLLVLVLLLLLVLVLRAEFCYSIFL